MTADYVIMRKSAATGSRGERCLIVLYDVGTEWLTVYPAGRRDSETTYFAIAQHAGRSKVQYAHIDNAPELMDACRRHRIAFETSAPYVHQTNGLIESINRVEIFGGRVCLEQAGAPICFWPYAVEHFAFSRNIHPVASRGVPYERRHKEPFVGLVVPFMARVRFKPQPNVEKSTEVEKMDAMMYGVFMGWSVNPGGKWNKRYYCAALSEFKDMDLRYGGKVFVQEVFEVEFDANEIFFPLKRLHDDAVGTIEGLRAPRSSATSDAAIDVMPPATQVEISAVPPVGSTSLQDQQGPSSTGDNGAAMGAGANIQVDPVAARAGGGDGQVSSTLANAGSSSSSAGQAPGAPAGSSASGSGGPTAGDGTSTATGATRVQPTRAPLTSDSPWRKSSLQHMYLSTATSRPSAWPSYVPWPVPSHWSLSRLAEEKLATAVEFARPHNYTAHPDIFTVEGGTVLRGMFYGRSTRRSDRPRVPDIDP